MLSLSATVCLNGTIWNAQKRETKVGSMFSKDAQMLVGILFAKYCSATSRCFLRSFSSLILKSLPLSQCDMPLFRRVHLLYSKIGDLWNELPSHPSDSVDTAAHLGCDNGRQSHLQSESQDVRNLQCVQWIG